MRKIRERIGKWVFANEERFYRTFLVTLILLFGALAIFWLYAVAGFVVSAMWLYFYETIVRKSNRIHGKLY